MRLYEAIDIFDENTSEIILALISNIQEKTKELETKQKEVLSLLTTESEKEIAKEVHKISVQNETQEMTHSLKALVRHKNAKNTPQSQHRITDTDIARAKEYPIQDLYIGKLRKATGKFAWCGKCELHNDSTASFYIDKNNNYHCFGCHAHGDAISYFMITRNIKSFPQAVKTLAHI